PSGTFLQRAVTCLVLGLVGHVVPDESPTVRRLLIDADDAIARFFEETHHLAPTGRIVPVFALPRALHPNTDVGLGDGPAAIDECDLRRHLGWVDAEDVTCRAVDSDLAEIAGHVVLMVDDYALLVEVHRNRVGRVIVLGLDLLERQQGDVWICRAK